MAHKKIADLIDMELAGLQSPAVPKPSTQSAPVPQTPKIPESVSLESTDSDTAETPRYLQLERKEVRLRTDQMDSLTKLSRKLNRNRKGKGERITENTLIRVAIDLLLQDSDRVAGLTEDELLESLGLPPADV